MFNLKGKVALVAGGAGYFGAPVCLGLAEQGAQVLVADIDDAGTKAAIQAINEKYPETKVTGTHLNVAEEDSIRAVVELAISHFGQLDILINATYASSRKEVEALKGELFDQTLHINLTGNFLLAREAANVMKAGSCMVFFSSMYGHISPDPRVYEPPENPKNPVDYGAAKAGIEQMTRYLAVHWAERNIRVNAVAPGPFPHPHQRTDYPSFMEKLTTRNPLRRLGERNEMTGAVVFLASDEASFVTGQVLCVDGGWTIW